MPGIDELTIDGGLSAYRFEPDAIKEGRQQRMPIESLINRAMARDARSRVPASDRIDADPEAVGWSVRRSNMVPSKPPVRIDEAFLIGRDPR